MRVFSSVFLALLVSLSGCSIFQVYTVDVPQGTPISQTQASVLRLGMSQEQVLNALGTPALQDTLNPNRWDYIYDYTAGTEGQKMGKANIKNNNRLSVYLDTTGRVIKIDGIDTLPQK